MAFDLSDLASACYRAVKQFRDPVWRETLGSFSDFQERWLASSVKSRNTQDQIRDLRALLKEMERVATADQELESSREWSQNNTVRPYLVQVKALLVLDMLKVLESATEVNAIDKNVWAAYQKLLKAFVEFSKEYLTESLSASHFIYFENEKFNAAILSLLMSLDDEVIKVPFLESTLRPDRLLLNEMIIALTQIHQFFYVPKSAEDHLFAITPEKFSAPLAQSFTRESLSADTKLEISHESVIPRARKSNISEFFKEKEHTPPRKISEERKEAEPSGSLSDMKKQTHVALNSFPRLNNKAYQAIIPKEWKAYLESFPQKFTENQVLLTADLLNQFVRVHNAILPVSSLIEKYVQAPNGLGESFSDLSCKAVAIALNSRKNPDVILSREIHSLYELVLKTKASMEQEIIADNKGSRFFTLKQRDLEKEKFKNVATMRNIDLLTSILHHISEDEDEDELGHHPSRQ